MCGVEVHSGWGGGLWLVWWRRWNALVCWGGNGGGYWLEVGWVVFCGIEVVEDFVCQMEEPCVRVHECVRVHVSVCA